MKKKIDIDYFYNYDVDLSSRTIYIGNPKYTAHGDDGGVDSMLSERVIKGLLLLDNAAPNGDSGINIILNSEGGDYYQGMAIYDAIKQCRNEVIVTVYGIAASMGSLILQAAKHRRMSKHAKLIIHWGYFNFEGHSKTSRSWSDEEERINNEMVDIYLQRIYSVQPNFKKQKLKEMLNFDTFLDARATVDMGLADEVLE